MPKNPSSLAKILTALSCAAALFASSGTAQSAVGGPGTLHEVTLAWNPPSDPDIAGYRVHVGIRPDAYTLEYDTEADLSVTIPGLEYGQTYYFAVRAINTAGVEGILSDELALTVAPPPLPVAGGIAPAGAGQLGLNWSYPVSALGSSPEFIIQSSTDLVNWRDDGKVDSSQITGGTATTANYSYRVIPVAGQQKFYRLTARNWMGDSVAP